MSQPIIPGPAYRILTARLCIRCWHPEDAPRLKAAVDASRSHLIPWMTWAREEKTPQEHIERLRQVRGAFDLGKDFTYGIFNQDESLVLGSTGLHKRADDRARMIGYWIHVDHIRQGYATETAGALTKVAFLIEGVDRVEISCDPANTASAAIPQKLGYTHEATLRRRIYWSEARVEDALIWSIFADEYPSSPAARIEIQAFDAAGREIPL
jgi:RimJ/RimL family protein N-acetyltransferase